VVPAAPDARIPEPLVVWASCAGLPAGSLVVPGGVRAEHLSAQPHIAVPISHRAARRGTPSRSHQPTRRPTTICPPRIGGIRGTLPLTWGFTASRDWGHQPGRGWPTQLLPIEPKHNIGPSCVQASSKARRAIRSRKRSFPQPSPG